VTGSKSRTLERPALILAATLTFSLATIASGHAQDAYKIGVTAAMTGPAAATQAPVIDMLRIYVDRLNASGGIGGHKITLLIEDDQGEPSKAAANAGKLIKQESVALLIDSSLSSTYGPVIAESRRAKVPLWFAGAVCPKESHPPKPDPVLFCSTGFDFSYDIPVAINAIKDMAKDSVKIGMIGMPIPISRIGIDNAEKQGDKLGFKTVEKQFIPPTAADYTPFATKLVEGAPNWAFAYAPWPTEVKTFEAMRRLGWTGSYMTYGHIQAEEELARVKDNGFHVFSANAFFQDDLPVQKEIRTVAEAGKYAYPASYSTEGWITGRALEQVLKSAGWPATPDKVRQAMDKLNLDTQGLRGGALVWTADNHFRTRQYYRFYRYDTGKNAVVRERDWLAIDVVD
jgi:ABC-type branched-subunit amino acid transport system substrate-binding protein